MKEGKNKPVKWHLSVGPANPRIRAEKLEVCMHMLNDYNKDIVLRAKDVKARDVIIYIDNKTYDTMIYEIKRVVKIKTFFINPIYLFANGMRIAIIMAERDKAKAEPKVEEKPEDVEEKLNDEEETTD